MPTLAKHARFMIAVILLLGLNSVAFASVKAVIFDCDGVLVDTEYLKFEAWREALSQHNVTFTINDYLPLVGHSSEKIASEIEKQKHVSFEKKIVITEKNTFYKNRQAQGVPPIPEAVTFLKSLLANKARYNIKVGLASSAPHAEIKRNLESIGVNSKDFDAIASGDDDLKHIVDPEGTNKPKPYIYQVIAKSLSVTPEDCIVFEDTNAGIEAAVGAGMKVFAVPNQYTKKQDFKKSIQVISFDKFTIKDLKDRYLSTINERERVIGFVNKAKEYVERQGKEKAFAEFNKRTGIFSKNSNYIFAVDYNGIFLATINYPALIGTNQIDLKDSSGIFLVREEIEKARSGGGWIDGRLKKNPQTGNHECKNSYFLPMEGGYFIGSGYYYPLNKQGDCNS